MKIDTSNKNYRKQINRVIDYIQVNLDKPLSMEELSKLVDFSPYYFHRLFTSIIGESLAKYVLRKRLERSASLLLGDVSLPVMNIAYECGFNSVNVFCRNFKRYFGVTAEEYRSKEYQMYSKNRQQLCMNGTTACSYTDYFCCRKTIVIGGKTMNCTFEIRKLSGLNIIYCRHQGPFDQMQSAFMKLMQWAYPRGLATAPEMKLLSVYHDNPNITEKDKLIADAGMVVAEGFRGNGEIGQYRIDGGIYAVGRFEISMEEFPSAWNVMFELVSEHGCQCTKGYHYEIYQNNREEHPERKWVIDICIPVKVKE